MSSDPRDVAIEQALEWLAMVTEPDDRVIAAEHILRSVAEKPARALGSLPVASPFSKPRAQAPRHG